MADAEPDLAALLAEEEELRFESFDEDAAWALGCALVDAARAASLGVAIDIRRGDQRLFHAALPGTTPDNDAWIERKSRAVRRFGHSSFYLGESCRQAGTTLADRYLVDPREYAAHGGSFPVHVRGVGIVGTVTVSGLPQAEDHAFVVDRLRRFLAS